MSRVLDALRNLQQPPSVPVARGEKVTPRLAASIRRAVLGSQADKSNALAQQSGESLLLFRVPEIVTPTETQVAAEVAANPATIVEPIAQTPVADPAHDSLSLVDAIAASLREAAHDDVPTTAMPRAQLMQTETASQPLPPTRPEPTASELEIFNILADVRGSEPYRNLLKVVRRDTRGLASPVVALIGLDERDGTAFVAACLGALLSEEESRRALLLLEAHGTNRTLAKMYGVPHAIGLCEQLAGRAERSQVVVPTSQQNLHVLPFGRPHAEEVRPLIGKLHENVRQFCGEYEMVLVDAGPLSTPWAVATSQAADVTYLLVRLGDALVEQAVVAVNQFRAAGGKVSGCVAIDAVTGLRI